MSSSPVRRRRRVFRCAAASLVGLGLALTCPGSSVAAEPEVDLKKAVLLVGAQGNEKLQQEVESGNVRLRVPFNLTIKREPGRVMVSDFAAEGKPPHRVSAKVSEVGGATPATADREVTVSLQRGSLELELALDGLRPNTTYKGHVNLISGPSSHAWEITLKAADRGTLVAGKLPLIKLVTLHPCSFVTVCAALPKLTGGYAGSDRFVITLRDGSDQGPYGDVRLRFEETRAPASNALTSNFSIDALAFWAADGDKLQSVDLGRHAGVEKTGGASSVPVLTVPKGSSVTLWAQATNLSPGEYSGTLRFTAGGASEQGEDSKLALTLQVRHHWWVAVVVAIVGAALGWFTNKFVQGTRTARRLRADGRAMSQRVSFMIRPDLARSGWQFPGEASSYALARIRVILNQVDRLARTTFVVIAAEQEITDRLAEARRRLDTLELFRDTRLDLQAVADRRPAAQHAIGGQLRRALDVLDGAAFDEVKRDAVTAALQELKKWLVRESQAELYCKVVSERLRDAREQFAAAGLGTSVAGASEPTLASTIRRLVSALPASETICQRTHEELIRVDHDATRVIVLLRDGKTPWSEKLVQAGEDSIEELFRIADEGLWETLEEANKHKKIRFVKPPRQPIQTYDPVEIRLTVDPPDLEDKRELSVPDSRLRHHRCRVLWNIAPSESGSPRTMETDGLTLVQYFPEPDVVNVQAQLIWNGKHFDVDGQCRLDVTQNPDYRLRAGLSSRVEVMVTGIAALFAIVTGLSAVYDATFGSANQYITLFLWAAGASTVGNLAKQLGSSPTPTASSASATPAAGSAAQASAANR